METANRHRSPRKDGARTCALGTWAIALVGVVGIFGAGNPARASNLAGVTDFTHAKITAIQVDDLTEALAASRGTRIEPVDRPTAHLPGFFEPRSATIRPPARALLEKVGRALASSELEPFRFSIEWKVEGDTSDDSGELASQRAAAVRDILVAQGVAQDRLGSIGPVEGDGTPALSIAERWQVALMNLGLAP